MGRLLEVEEQRENNRVCPVCKSRLNMPPRYCSKVCEDSAMAGFERERERFGVGTWVPRSN